MLKIYLYLIDILVPLLFGTISFLLGSSDIRDQDYIFLFFTFSVSIFGLSAIKNYYKDYFLIHFSEKIKIAVLTWLFAIFVQLILLSYFLIRIDMIIFISWVLIPIAILILKYLIKLYSELEMKYPIQFIGKNYQFNDYEIKTLTDKGFIIFFYDSLEQYLSKSTWEKESILVMNLLEKDVNKFHNKKVDISRHKIYNLEEFFEKYLRKIYITSDNYLVDIHSYDRFDYFLKRLIDFVSVIILLPFLFVLIIYVYIIKKINKIYDPILYKQERYGLKNHTFNIYKLRTMKTDSDLEGNTSTDDPRIYSFAAWLRKYRLDELPQIINILLGEMHLVGPRAEWVKLSDEYSRQIDIYSLRHTVKPGITGWAQVLYQYGYDVDDSRQKLMYELYYIKNWTLWLELEICIKTIIVIFKKKGL